MYLFLILEEHQILQLRLVFLLLDFKVNFVTFNWKMCVVSSYGTFSKLQ